MRSNLLLARLGCAAFLLILPTSVPAKVGEPIAGIPIGLEGDPGSVIVATTKTDAAGKFEFQGLKAGKYRLVIAPAGTTRTIVADGAQLQLQRTITITVTPVNDAPSISDAAPGVVKVGQGDVILNTIVGTQGGIWTGRSQQAITVAADGGAIHGAFKIADNNSPLPQDRKLTNAPTGTVDQPSQTLIPYVTNQGGFDTGTLGRVPGAAVDPSDPTAKSNLGLEQTVRAPVLILTPGVKRTVVIELSEPVPVGQNVAAKVGLPNTGGGILPSKHNYKGIVTLVKIVAPAPTDDGGKLPSEVSLLIQGSDGKALPNAKVQITNNESGETKTLTADAAGGVLWAPIGSFFDIFVELSQTAPNPAQTTSGTPSGTVTNGSPGNPAVPTPGNLIPSVAIKVEGNPESIAAGTTTTVYGQTVTFTATVTAGGGTGVPTGTVTFLLDEATNLGTTKLQQGSGSYTITPLAAGNHTITAQYSGDSNFAAGVSKSVTFTVTVPPTPTNNTYTGTIVLQGDPGNIPVATTKTDADGKFEFKNLKAGKYHLVVSPTDPNASLTKVGQGTLELSSDSRSAKGSGPTNLPQPTANKDRLPDANGILTIQNGSALGASGVALQQRVIRLTNVRGNGNLRVEGLTELVGDDVLLPINPETGRTEASVYTVTFGGSLSGTFKIAENESPRPQARQAVGSPMPPVPGEPDVVNLAKKKSFEGYSLGVQVHEQDDGLLIQRVKEGSLAEHLGLLPKDRIFYSYGLPTTTVEALGTQLQAAGEALKANASGFAILSDIQRQAGDPALFVVHRGDQILEVRACGPAGPNTRTIWNPVPNLDIGLEVRYLANGAGPTSAGGQPRTVLSLDIRTQTEYGTFISFQDGNLTLLVPGMMGEEPKLKEFGRVTTVSVDPSDPMTVKTLPAEEAFKNLKVGTPVYVRYDPMQQILVSLGNVGLPQTGNPAPNSGAPGTAALNTNSTIGVDSGSSLTPGGPTGPDAWRFKLINNEWWYYGLDKKWMIFRGGKWIDFNAPGTAVAGPIAGDFDGDGKVDLPQTGTASGGKVRVAVGDVNGDGVPDARVGTPIPAGSFPGLGSPVGGILPGRRLIPGTNGGNTGGTVRGALGGKR